MDPLDVAGEFLPIILVDLNASWIKMLSRGVPMSFPGQTIIAWRDLPSSENGMYLVRRGMVRLSYISPGGKERVLFYVGQGTLFHEIPMLHKTRDYLFTCMEPTEAIFLPKKLITPDFVRQHPELILNMYEALGVKMRILYSSLCGEYSFDSFANVCRVLYSMHLFNRVKGEVVPRLARQELAAFLGIHRSSLHKALTRLHDEGVIGAYSKKKLPIHDAAALLQYASGF